MPGSIAAIRVNLSPEREEPMKLRVLLATSVPPPEQGGITNWTRVVCEQLQGEADLEMSFVDTGRRYRALPNWPTLRRLLFGPPQAIRVIWQSWRRMWADRPDVFHMNTSASFGTVRDIVLLYIARWLGVRSVAHYHMQQPPGEISPNGIHWKLLRWAMSLADAVVILDKRSEDRVRAALPNKRITILPTMVEMDVIEDIQRHSPSHASNNTVKLVFVGFLAPVKGVRELFQAFLKLPDGRVTLDLIGKFSEPALGRELESLVATSGKADRVRFHGLLPHKQAIRQILDSDVLLLPSYAESAPAVILEAMGCGKPVVSTSTGAIPDMLDIGGPQQCGLCVPSRDVDALAAAIMQLVADRSLRDRFGRFGRQRAETLYSAPVGCSQLLDLWRSVAQHSNAISSLPR